MKYLLVCLFIFFSIIISFGQDVNLSTGTAQISLPIYTLSEGELNVPIEINYDASGLRIDKNASSEDQTSSHCLKTERSGIISKISFKKNY